MANNTPVSNEPTMPTPTIGTTPVIPMAAPPEAPKAPELRVSVLDPEGNLFTIPEDQVSKAVFQDKALKLAPVLPYKAGDVNKDGTVNLVSKDGAATQVKADQAQAVLKSNNGYLLKSEYDRFQDPEVQKAYNLLDFGSDKDKQTQTKNLFTENPSGELPMINKEGVKVNVPRDEIEQARGAGFEFIDPKFQALYDAFLYREKISSGVDIGTVASTLKGYVYKAPGGKSFISALRKGESAVGYEKNNVEKAAEFLIESGEINQEAEKLGGIASIGTQILMPEGLFGEVALAGKAAKAVKGIKALESSPILASVLAHAAEGAVIAAPQAADALIQGNPKLAAESLGLGTLGGVLLGELPGVLSAGANKLKGLGEDIAATRALTSLGAEEGLLKATTQAKSKILDTLVEAGLKETSTAEKTFQVLNEVSGGSKMSSLEKLSASGEKIATGSLQTELNGLVQRAPEVGEQLTLGGGAISNKLSPELEKTVNELNSKLEKLGTEASLSDVQKLSSELSSKISRVRANNEVNNFMVQARDLVMEELFKAGDAAAAKASPQVAMQWAEQKSIAQAAAQMQGGFEANVFQAEKLAGKALTPELADKVIQGGVKNLFQSGAAAVGHTILPGVGGWLGVKLGEGLGEKIGEKVAGSAMGQKVQDTVKPFLDKILPGSGGKNWILKNADNPNVSSYIAMNAIHNTNTNLQQIPELFRGKVIQGGMFAANPDPIKSLLGSQANGLSKAQQFSRLSDRVSHLAGNEELRGQYLDQMTQVMAKNHPELANGLKVELTNKIMAINDLLHTGNKAEPVAFQKQTKYTPTKDQMAKIEAGLKVIDNPYALLEGMKNGKVSAQQVALVKQTYPAIYQEMVNEINKVAYSGKASDLTYQQRLSASAITGQPMDASLKHGSVLQATFAQGNATQTPETVKASPSPKNEGRKSSGNSKSIKASTVASYTAAQRIASV